jgi:hypothetical protein
MVREAYENQFVDTKHERHVDYFSEFFDDPNTAIRTLQLKRVLILGLGGVGCITVQHLVSAGIRHYVLVDCDTVSPSNLNRQFCYTPKDLGLKKTEAMRKYIKLREPEASIKTFYNPIRSAEDMEKIIHTQPDVDMVACCFDNDIVITDELVTKVCLAHVMPCCFCGVHLNFGFWGPTLVEKEKMINYAEFLSYTKSYGFSSNPVKASIGFTNTVISSLFVKDIIMHLSGAGQIVSLNRMLRFSFDSCEIKELATF